MGPETPGHACGLCMSAESRQRRGSFYLELEFSLRHRGSLHAQGLMEDIHEAGGEQKAHPIEADAPLRGAECPARVAWRQGITGDPGLAPGPRLRGYRRTFTSICPRARGQAARAGTTQGLALNMFVLPAGRCSVPPFPCW